MAEKLQAVMTGVGLAGPPPATITTGLDEWAVYDDEPWLWGCCGSHKNLPLSMNPGIRMGTSFDFLIIERRDALMREVTPMASAS